ncbi:AAA family ATPase [Ruminococcus flavefaciens]|uniref:AAA family ATPase n=1 Tax=Ruminococcus flavefaciens TaxID=1265 RepID=UPI0026EB4D31|nr:AAA family ATPase [Ruminococcus flavefaciens]
MGTYVNPGNAGFKRIAGPNYVDKTMLIELMNERIGTEKNLVCISRPRRFGKSYAAKMLTAYYDCTCDSHKLFDNRKISKVDSYEEYLNKYNVVYLDITGFISKAKALKQPLGIVPANIITAITKELYALNPEMPADLSLEDCFTSCVNMDGGKQFIFIIDEWDAMIREAKNDPEAQEAYLSLLRGWFKNGNFTDQVVAAAYMTGILPIKKDGSQSAISDFKEFTMIKPLEFGGYVGFTEAEVKSICEKKNADFDMMKKWYDGYSFKNVGSVYNPNSVMNAISNDDFDSYWTETSAAEGLLEYISKDYNGMTKTIAELIGGVDVKVSTTGFANDLTTFRGRDDVLTLMIHLGYLAYDSVNETVRIPNEEIKKEFSKAVKEVNHKATLDRLKESEQLFIDTINRNEEAVAAQIEKIHREETAPLHYNKEDSLRSIIKLAYYSYKDQYVQFEELAAGEGYADVAYIPRHDSNWPALIIELKWNKDVKGAIDQILNKKYPDALKNFGTKILLVGISYEKDATDNNKKHTCKIIEYIPE